MYINPRVPPKLTYPMSGDYDALIAHKHYEEPTTTVNTQFSHYNTLKC